ncbi:MAG: ClC family H(+)/Cl(-) exchange transporter, partial [Actinomycetota bacterium]|nr:ClC family H(+)/Cl(-) exchange transporter [Actinomycetota bacterium]
MTEKNDILSTFKNWSRLRFTLIFDGVIVGAFTGLIIVLFRYLILKGETFTQKIYSYAASNLRYLPLLILGLIALAFITGYLIKKEPQIRGSGIPQVEGFLLKKMNMSWWRVLISKFIGTIITISSGLSMGREGPSVQIGASVGLGYSRIFKKARVNENFLVTSGASAGLAAAFNAPLSGVIFALEEVHKNFSSLVLLSAISASIAADFISMEFFGMNPIFNIKNVAVLPLSSYGYIIMLGIVIGLFGAFFNISLLKIKDLYTKYKWLSVIFRPLAPFLLVGLIATLIPQALGGGHKIVDLLNQNTFSWKFLLILLAVKFLFTMISYGSGAPGGIFM